MAKVLSHLFTVMRGSIAGVTYLSGPTSAIIARARVSPVQPVSIPKNDARGAWTAAQGTWELLTSPIQQDWNDYAKTVTFQGATGPYTLPGRQLFQGGKALQNYILAQGLAVPTFITTAPLTQGFLLPSQIGTVAPAGPGTGIGVSITGDEVDDCLAFIQISTDLGKNVNFWKGPYNAANAQAAVVGSGQAVLTDFLNLRLGGKYFFRVKCVADDAAPRLSQEFFFHGEAVTVP